MKTEKPTAAEALAEWNRYEEARVLAFVRNDHELETAYKNECDKRATLLDEMCKKAGLSMVDGRLKMTSFDEECNDGGCYVFQWTSQWINNPDEFIALLQWLQLKEKQNETGKD